MQTNFKNNMEKQEDFFNKKIEITIVREKDVLEMMKKKQLDQSASDDEGL